MRREDVARFIGKDVVVTTSDRDILSGVLIGVDALKRVVKNLVVRIDNDSVIVRSRHIVSITTALQLYEKCDFCNFIVGNPHVQAVCDIDGEPCKTHDQNPEVCSKVRVVAVIVA